jgi:hypothetical protein
MANPPYYASKFTVFCCCSGSFGQDRTRPLPWRRDHWASTVIISFGFGSFGQSGVACLRQARVRLAGVKLAGLDRLGFVRRDFGGGTARVCLAEIACRFLEGVAGQRRCEPTLWLRNHCQLARLGDISALTLSQRMGICVGV